MGRVFNASRRDAGQQLARTARLVLLSAFLLAAQHAAMAERAPGADDALPQAPPTLLRPLRENVPFEIPPPIDPLVFSGYSGVPPFSVVPRIDQLMFYPCMNCHAAKKPDPRPRKLTLTPHPAALLHGKGRFWCLTCHEPKDRNMLQTLAGQPVSFDQAYLVCGQCHFNRQKDWFYGGHGKRLHNWQGERVIYSCTFCHDPHDPTLKPRAPSPPPPVRAGLHRMAQENARD